MKKIKKINNIKTKGFSLIELTVVLVIVAIIIGGVAILAGTSVDKAKMEGVSKFIQLTNISVKEDAKFDGSSYTGVTTSLVANLTVMQGYRRGSGGSASIIVENLPVTVVSDTTIAADDSLTYTITGGLANEQCKELLQKSWKLFNALTLNGSSVKANSSVPYNAANAAIVQNSCDSTTDNNVMQWTVQG